MDLRSRDAMTMPDSFVPEHNREGLIDYIERGIMPGSFLTAILQNDLFGAYGKADHINSRYVRNIVTWIYNYAPHNCFGSPEAVNEYVALIKEYNNNKEKS